MKKPLWTPSNKQRINSNMWKFMEYVNEQYNLQLTHYQELYKWSIEHMAEFWQAVWTFCEIRASREWISVLNKTDDFPHYEWFKGSRLNFAENLLRCATNEALKEKPAIVFWGEDIPEKTQLKRTITYEELQQQVVTLAQAMRKAGITQGDRVAAFMPNVPETIVAMLATTSIGAIWSSCSPDFGSQAVLNRFGQIEPKLLFCCDGYTFKGKEISSLETIKNLEENIPNLEHIIVIPYLTYNPNPKAAIKPDISSLMKAVHYRDFIEENKTRLEFEYTQLPFNHPLYIMYSSGTTGKPKCIVHSAGGTLIQHLKELVLHTNLSVEDKIFYFTTCGWMMWNWLVSSLASGATVMLYDGAPMHPYPDWLFQFAESEGITVFGTSAKYLSALEKSGAQPERIYNLKIRTILSTGSPLLPETYDYVYKYIEPKVQLSSISGGTDILSCFALGNPMLPVQRGELQSIGLGMDVNVLNEYGNRVENEKGELTCKPPFPSMPLYFWNDPKHKKYKDAYFTKFPRIWAHGDYAQTTDHGGLIIYGRSDATLNPGGVRIGTSEIYQQVEKLSEVMESIAVGQEWQGDTRIVLFVKLRENSQLDEDLKATIIDIIKQNTSARHVPTKIIQVPDIPRTISGKIVELAVADVIHGREVKNKEALANPEILDAFKDIPELKEA